MYILENSTYTQSINYYYYQENFLCITQDKINNENKFLALSLSHLGSILCKE